MQSKLHLKPTAGAPGVTQAINALRTKVPFFLPPAVSLTQNTRSGHGTIVPVTAAANTNVNAAHGLGRIPAGMMCLLNNGGADFDVKLKFGSGTSDNNNQSIQGDGAMTNALIFFF